MDENDVFRALADPTRRRLLDQLHADNGQTLDELCRGLAMTRQAVSQHLARLEAANLVTTARQGRTKLHYLNPVPVHDIYERWIEKFERQRLHAVHDLKKRAEETTMDKPGFVYVTYIAAPPEKLWNALTDPQVTRHYWQAENVSDWQPGSRWEHRRTDVARTLLLAGKVIESDPPRRLVLTWADPADEAHESSHSRVTFEIEPYRGGTRLAVTHDRLEPHSEMLEGISEGWPKVLSSLKSLLEAGRPLPELW
jgi:uncharacterized protein YndB with AHSA1/START domain/DNA-binding transcriptional ArsR family regulator